MENLLHINIVAFLATGGYIALAAIVFMESGFFLFLPGDSLLFAAGLLAANGVLNIVPVILATVLSATSGYLVSYWLGNSVGPRIFKKKDSLIFNEKYLKETESFYNKYGTWTVILARFVPFVRTIAPVLAGAGKMGFTLFAACAIGGAILWGVSIPLLGFYLGTAFPWIGDHLSAVTLAVLVLSFVPLIIAFSSRNKKK